MAKKQKIYAVVDIETTGGRSNMDKITEIAVVRHDGENILDTYQTLVNPEMAIPYHITQITGITQDMVADAPRFFEIAKKVVEMTNDAIFVAHNVRFDYGFLQNEFKRLGYNFTKRQLCTVRLSRQAFPGLPSYSLGNLIKYFKIKVNDRHRAYDDAVAAAKLLQMALHQDGSEENITQLVDLGIKESQLPQNITLEKLHNLPEECGVYYFHDKEGELVYIGKSINIKKRVMEHFANKKKKGDLLQKSVHEISYEITGSELVALLKESQEIKYHHPYVNRAQRARNFQHVIHHYKNEEGYICLNYKKPTAKDRDKLNILRAYPTQMSARGNLTKLLEEFELCQLYCNIDSTGKPCFYYHLHKCAGACIGEESPEEYNARVMEAAATISMDFDGDFILLDKGRTTTEFSVVLVEGGRYQGFGFIEKEDTNGDIEVLKDVIKPHNHNPEVVGIIQRFALNGKVEKLIKL
jgi:DNA polymerase III subunit epsilon